MEMGSAAHVEVAEEASLRMCIIHPLLHPDVQ
jgi:hypothetical protein